MFVLSGSSNQKLAESIAAEIDAQVLQAELTQFRNGERRVYIPETVSGETIVVVQSFSTPADTHIIEFLLMIDALERLGAHKVFAVIPWMGYSLQDKAFREGEPIAAKVIARLVSQEFVKRVLLLDLHNSSISGFFSVPTMHLYPDNLFESYIHKTYKKEKLVVVSPDFGGIKRARYFANKLDVPFSNIEKHRNLKTGEVTVDSIQGELSEIQDSVAILYDDCILSGSTAVHTAQMLKKYGAKKVVFCASHGVFVDGSEKHLSDDAIDEIVITNSVAQHLNLKKITYLDCAPLFCEQLKKWDR